MYMALCRSRSDQGKHVEKPRKLKISTYHIFLQPCSSQAILAPSLNQKGNQEEFLPDH